MHELGIARDIVRRAVEEAERQKAMRIQMLHITLGPQALAYSEALSFGIQAASQGTLAEGAGVCITESQEGGIVLEAIELSEE